MLELERRHLKEKRTRRHTYTWRPQYSPRVPLQLPRTYDRSFLPGVPPR